MKIELQAVVARVNGKAVAFQGIDDAYTSTQLAIKEEDLEGLGVEFWKTVASTSWWTMNNGTFNIGEQEAKDLYTDVDGFTIKTETFEVEL